MNSFLLELTRNFFFKNEFSRKTLKKKISLYTNEEKIKILGRHVQDLNLIQVTKQKSFVHHLFLTPRAATDLRGYEFQ